MNIFPCTERDAPPVIYTNPTPMSPPDDFKQISSKEKEFHGKKYNVGNEKGYRETLQGRESNGNHNSFDEKALDTYSPFFQGQDSDEHIKEGISITILFPFDIQFVHLKRKENFIIIFMILIISLQTHKEVTTGVTQMEDSETRMKTFQIVNTISTMEVADAYYTRLPYFLCYRC